MKTRALVSEVSKLVRRSHRRCWSAPLTPIFRGCSLEGASKATAGGRSARSALAATRRLVVRGVAMRLSPMDDTVARTRCDTTRFVFFPETHLDSYTCVCCSFAKGVSWCTVQAFLDPESKTRRSGPTTTSVYSRLRKDSNESNSQKKKLELYPHHRGRCIEEQWPFS